MGLFNSVFGQQGKKSATDEKKSGLQWIPLTNIAELETIKALSATESVFVFKHSTRCGISSMVLKRFEKLFTEEHQHLKVYYLDLLNYRAISDEVGYTFQVMHQSPQLLVIKNGVAVHHASHYDILEINLSRFL